MLPRALLIFLFLLCRAVAVDSLEQSFTCPICEQQWKERIETSSRPTAMRLDLRRLGDVVDPPTLPQCPKCKFVVFSDRIPEATIAKLKPFVQGQEYQSLAAKGTTYFCLAQIQKVLRAPGRFIGQSYLRASWQVETRDFIALRYLTEAEKHFGEAMEQMLPSEKPYIEAALLRGEVMRRLSRWADAEKFFRDLQGRPEFQHRKTQQIILQELAYIARKDSQPQLLRELPPERQHTVDALPDPEPISVTKPSAAESKENARP